MDHNTPGMEGMEPPSHTDDDMPMMHMAFFWSKNAEILFSGWPGRRTGMYALALIFIFVLCVIVEWLSHCKWIKKSSSNVSAGLIQTAIYGLRIGLAYMVMLAVMSFNVGVFIVAVCGHTFGFFLFGSSVSKKSDFSDLPPQSC
ncbi:copper transporter 1-like [Olea europaea subsp. europaea]|uniref:Copper transport protein n=1 Tax=Olea europaea subsp. europaea TaxID=158383 RepID=A0A8S0QUC2_OLEEU|nr:copper transporter 1-like [Olea europaea subsp. europaea]